MEKNDKPSREEFEIFMCILNKGKVSYKINPKEFSGVKCLEEKSEEDQKKTIENSVDRLAHTFNLIGFTTIKEEGRIFSHNVQYWVPRKGLEKVYGEFKTYEEFMKKFEQTYL